MINKIIFLALVFLFTSLATISQGFEKRFKELSSTNDTSGQSKLLKEWEATTPKDPEFFIAYFNFYAMKSIREVVSLDADKKDQKGLVLTDTGTGKPVAYLNSSIKYNSEILQKGFDYINKGIVLHPTRLDMRFGKIYMLGEAENYPVFSSTIVETIDYGNQIKNAWLWKEGKPLEDAKKFFLSSIQDYVGTIYNTENDNLLPYMRQISQAVLTHYPNHVESLSNIALTYLIVGENDKALPHLLKAETIAPKDIIILNNIAETYKRKKDKPNAKAYYEKIIKHGRKDDVEDAKEKLKNL